MDRFRRRILPLLALLLVCSPLSGQESYASLVYAEGSVFSLVRGGNRVLLEVGVDDIIGMPLYSGDTLLTEAGTFLELQLASSALVKVAENTTFTLEDIQPNGGGTLRVAYGRIRAKVQALVGGTELWVTGYDTVAGVRGTDFGYDLFYDQGNAGSERITSVYCFEGEVGVLKIGDSAKSKLDLMDQEPTSVTSGQMVRVSSLSQEAPKTEAIDQAIESYWLEQPFSSDMEDLPDAPVMATAPGDEPLIPSDDLSLDYDSLKYQYEISGKITFLTGVTFLTLGGLIRAFAPSDHTSLRSLGVGLIGFGTASTATGMGMIIYSLTLP